MGIRRLTGGDGSVSRRGASLALAALLLLLLVICLGSGRGTDTATASGSPGDRAQASIIRGSQATIEEFPWLVQVQYAGAVDEMGCTGTVVAPRVVLTAAHCVLSGAGRVERPAGFTVTTGTADLRLAKAKNRARVGRVLVFPGYDRFKGKFDAALLILANPVAAQALPMADWTDAGLLGPGTRIMVAGWGLLNYAPPVLPATLRKAAMQVEDNESCRQKTKSLFHLFPAYQFCAAPLPGRRAMTCHGDSGGPGIAWRPNGKPVLIGIIDLGAPDCAVDVPEVLVRVDRISDWAERWIDAVEFGDPAPRVWVPRIQIPYLGKERAKSYAALGLASDLGRRFLEGRNLRIAACLRLERAKVKCGIAWHRGRDSYSGTVTTFYAIRPEGELWHYRYRIRWTNHHCWLTNDHHRACRAGTRAR